MKQFSRNREEASVAACARRGTRFPAPRAYSGVCLFAAIQGDDWMQRAWTSPLSIFCLALAAISVVALLLLARAAIPLGAETRARRSSLLADCRGTATLEFVMVLPLLLFFSLLLAQSTFAMSGNIFTHYASYAATRTAIVTIPVQTRDESRNTVDVESGNKIEGIRASAAFALLPVAGRLPGPATAATDQLVSGLRNFYAAYGQNAPAWVDRLAADRLRYAMDPDNTRVVLMRIDDTNADNVVLNDLLYGMHMWGPREPVAVRVEHRFYLSVPYVWPLFAESWDNRYSLISAHCVLVNQGVDTELPLVPRVPPYFDDVMQRVVP